MVTAKDDKKRLFERINNKIQFLKSYSKSQSLTEAEQLIANYETILKTDPKDKEKWMNLGRAYDKRFNFEKAIESKLAAKQLNPNDPEVHFSLGCSFCAKGDFLSAIESYREALRCKPDFAEACSSIGEQYVIIGDGEKADLWFGKAQEIRFRKGKMKP